MGHFLVTGSTGFVGSWLTRRLLKEGHQVRVLCRNSSTLDQDLKEKCEIAEGDISDEASLTVAMNGIERVYHLAGLVGYTEDLRPAMEKTNVHGTQNIINICLAQKVNELVYMSSVVAVGASHRPEVLNEYSLYDIGDLNLGYFETKKKAEDLVIRACIDQGLKAYIINPSTIYGPGDFKKGSRKAQLKVARGKLPVYTFGGVSVVSIEDVIEAAINVTKFGRPAERYIISGDNITIKELFEMIASETGVPPPKYPLPTFLVRILGKLGLMSRETSLTATMYHWFDHSKAERELKIKFKSAAEAIKESVEWLKAHENEV